MKRSTIAVTITGAVVTAVASLAGSASGASPATTASAHNGPQGGGPHTAAVSAAATPQAVQGISASQVIANANDWYIGPDNPPYNQAGYWQSRTDYAGDRNGDNPRPGGNPPAWREDCSGFLAHAWGEVDGDGGFTTYTVSQYSTPIAWSQLQPGDALLFNGNVPGYGTVNHVALFMGWSSPTTYNLMDESTPGSGSQLDNNISVGNNFWKYGQPVRYNGLVNNPVTAYYSQLGGSSSYLGTPTDSPYPVAGGQAQDFTGGSIYWSAGTGAHAVRGSILTHYQALGGPGGFLGFPVTDETGTPDGVGRFNHFANDGSVYWTPSTGAWSVHGAVQDHWQALGWETGPLGYPTTDELGTPDGVGRFNGFSNDGAIYWTPQTGAWSVRGAVRDHWASLGWETGVLGYPTTDELGTPDGVGRFNGFSKGGSIYWTPRTGAWSVHGSIYSLWASMGWETSSVGYPTSDEYAIPGGRRNNFVSGIISWNAGTGVTTAAKG